MLPQRGSICGKLIEDLPSTRLQGGETDVGAEDGQVEGGVAQIMGVCLTESAYTVLLLLIQRMV